MLFPMIEASEFVSHEASFALVFDAADGTASTDTVQDQREAFADLRNGDRRRPVFFPDELLLPGTTLR